MFWLQSRLQRERYRYPWESRPIAMHGSYFTRSASRIVAENSRDPRLIVGLTTSPTFSVSAFRTVNISNSSACLLPIRTTSSPSVRPAKLAGLLGRTRAMIFPPSRSMIARPLVACENGSSKRFPRFSTTRRFGKSSDTWNRDSQSSPTRQRESGVIDRLYLYELLQLLHSEFHNSVPSVAVAGALLISPTTASMLLVPGRA